jgi:hypothetical protein
MISRKNLLKTWVQAIVSLMVTFSASSLFASLYEGTLVAGKDIVVGNFKIDFQDIQICSVDLYLPASNVNLVESHIDVQNFTDRFPVTKKGFPTIGKFTYSAVATHPHGQTYGSVIYRDDPIEENAYFAIQGKVLIRDDSGVWTEKTFWGRPNNGTLPHPDWTFFKENHGWSGYFHFKIWW